MLEGFWQDLKHSARSLTRTPIFLTTSLVILSVGMGVTTAIFAVVDTVVVRPLNYRDAERLYAVHEVLPAPGRAIPQVPVNARHFEEWQTSVRSFEEGALISPRNFILTGAGEPRRIDGARVSPKLFTMLGLRAEYGRTFGESDAKPGNDHVAVIAHDLWSTQFEGSPSAVGRTVRIGGVPYVVIGVLAADSALPKLNQLYALDFSVPGRPQLWVPFVPSPSELNANGAFNFAAIVRLRRGVSVSVATSELNGIQSQFARQMPGNPRLEGALVPLQDQITGRTRTGLTLIMVLAAVVLLVSCLNIASLLLTRGSARRIEFAVRLAAGSSRRRLVRQVLMESVALSLLGCVLGLLLAQGAIQLIISSASVDIPRLESVALDQRVLMFALAVSIGSGLLIGAMPAWPLMRAMPADALKASSKGATRSHSSSSRQFLVALEVGMSTVAAIVAVLLALSFSRLLRVDRGFDTEDIVAGTMSFPPSRNAETTTRFLDALRNEAFSLPGVTAVGVSDRLPLSGEGGNLPITIEGSTQSPGQRPVASLHLANGDYFRVLGIPVLAGRLIEETDRQRSPVAVISRGAADRIWPQQNPIGKRFRSGPDSSPLFEVVGIVGDVRGVSLDAVPRLDVYLPYWSTFIGQAAISLRTDSTVDTLSPALRSAIRRLDPEIAVPPFQTMAQLMSESLAPRRFQLTLVLVFAATALFLAGIGVYSVVSHTVAHRSNEIGIRMALGARPSEIGKLVLAEGLAPVFLGVVGGFGASSALGTLLRSVLFGVSLADATTFVTAGVVLIGIALTAIAVPLRRATGVDPVAALRAE